jgi:hypothetical protein
MLDNQVTTISSNYVLCDVSYVSYSGSSAVLCSCRSRTTAQEGRNNIKGAEFRSLRGIKGDTKLDTFHNEHIINDLQIYSMVK